MLVPSENKRIVNHPFTFTLSFQPCLHSLNQSCFVTTNIQHIQISGENPHFFITLYPQSESLFSFTLMKSFHSLSSSHLDCLHTITDGSPYPEIEPLSVIYDVQSPTLHQVASFSHSIIPSITLILQASEKTNFLKNLKLVQIKEGQIMEVFPEFDVMYLFCERMIFRFILRIQLSGKDSTVLHVPKEAIVDEAGNTMKTDLELSVTLRKYSSIFITCRNILNLHTNSNTS